MADRFLPLGIWRRKGMDIWVSSTVRPDTRSIGRVRLWAPPIGNFDSEINDVMNLIRESTPLPEYCNRQFGGKKFGELVDSLT